MLNFKNFPTGHVTVTEFQICIRVPNFIKIFFAEICRFYDLQYGGRPPSWVLSLYIMSRDLYRHAILLPCAKFHRNRTIGCWVMAKKRFWKWRPCATMNFENFQIGDLAVIEFHIYIYVPNFINIGSFFVDILRFHYFKDGGSSPSWILGVQ